MQYEQYSPAAYFLLIFLLLLIIYPASKINLFVEIQLCCFKIVCVCVCIYMCMHELQTQVGPLEEQYVLLITDPSLDLPNT